MSAQAQKTPHVALFTSPGMGHFIPFCLLARHLSCNFKAKVTLILLRDFCNSAEATSFLRNLNVDIVSVADLDTGDDSMGVEARIGIIVQSSIPVVLQTLKSADSSPWPVSALIVDFFCSPIIDPVAALGVPTYVFLTGSAAFLTFMYSVPALITQVSVSLKDFEFGIELPGLPAIPAKDFPSPILDRSADNYEFFKNACVGCWSAAGFLVNTFEGLESGVLAAFKDSWKHETKRVFAVGPVISVADAEKVTHIDTEKADCLQWLDLQLPRSVVYISFGSSITLSVDQLQEIAEGLERSGERFLWVVRPPANRRGGSYFKIQKSNVENLLPEGFIPRMKNRGLVVPFWAPQSAVLSHPAISGFVSHCGWNSTLESMFYGVPVIAWPVRAEQRLNAAMICRVYGVGISVKENAEGFVKKEELERVLREVMSGNEGSRVKERCQELKVQAREAVKPGGTSWNEMISFLSSME